MEGINQEALERLKSKVRGRYEKSQKTKIKLSFDELYQMFSNGSLSFRAIAQKVGVSSQRIHQLWEWHFCRLFPNIGGGKDRRKMAIARKLRQKEREDPTIPLLRRVAVRARSFGHSVFQAIDDRGNVYKKRLMIGDKPCAISSLSNLYMRAQKSSRFYSRGNLSITTIRKNSFLIIERQGGSKEYEYFIVPTSTLLENYLLGKRHRPFSIYVPSERFSYTQRDQPKVNFWSFHEAWHLLR